MTTNQEIHENANATEAWLRSLSEPEKKDASEKIADLLGEFSKSGLTLEQFIEKKKPKRE